MKTNTNKIPAPPVFTAQGAKAVKSTPIQELRRAVLSCMLWEDGFYESGEKIAERIQNLIAQVPLAKVAELAIEARTKMHLRHVPLMLVVGMVRYDKLRKSQGLGLTIGGSLISKTLTAVIQRPDELTEFMAMYWKDGKIPVSKQVKLGLAGAFHKFDEYTLSRYLGGHKNIQLRDVLFLSHVKPKDKAQEAMFKRLANNQLTVPDTWEIELLKGGDKKTTFERLLKENKLGYFALIRNLRLMTQEGVDEELIRNALINGAHKVHTILPYRFIAAARACPKFEPELDAAMIVAAEKLPKLPGKTVILVDTSPSMGKPLSEKSDLTRKDAACGLAVTAREICEHVRIFAFSRNIAEVPPRRGMALGDAIIKATPSDNTLLGAAVSHLNAMVPHDRLIVITDEESFDAVPASVSQKPYMINVASTQNGVGYGPWTRLTGFSEAILGYIQAAEALDVEG